MSTETYITVDLQFKGTTSESNKTKIVKEIGDLLECELTYNADWKDWEARDVNWSSHIYDDTIDELEKYIEEKKDDIESFDFSVYYLNEPYRRINYSSKESQDESQN